MRNIIILKGERNSGKSKTLKNFLPVELKSSIDKRNINYNGKRILIIRRSIHESHNWEEVISRIIAYKDHIIVIAAWLDTIVNESRFIPETLEAKMKERDPNYDSIKFSTVFTELQSDEEDQILDQQRCAKEIKSLIDKM